MRDLFIILVLAIASSPSVSYAEPIPVQYEELYTNSSNYKGKEVQISGWLNFHFEGSTVCESQEEISQCLSIKYIYKEKYENLTGKLVNVTGIFYPEDLDYEASRRENGKLVFQLGPYFHSMKDIRINVK